MILSKPEEQLSFVGIDFTAGDRYPPDFREWQRSVGIEPSVGLGLVWETSTIGHTWGIQVGKPERT
jgi:hypothetical protein